MTYLIILAAGLLPAVLLLVFIYKQDPVPEPWSQLKKAFSYGVLISFPVSAFEGVLSYGIFNIGEQVDSFFEAAVTSFLVAALVEEGFNLAALWSLVRRYRYFAEHFDGIVYAVFIGLGFAAIENVLYLFSNADNWVSVGLARAFLAVPGHYAFAVIMGYYYSMYHFVERSTYNRVMTLAAPIIAHGIYDTIAFSSDLSPELSGVCMLLLVFFCFRLHKFSYRKLLSHVDRDTRPFHDIESNM